MAAVKTPSVLVLGSGLVSPPLIHYLTAHGIYVIVASRTVSKAQAILKGITNAEAVAFDVDEPNAIETKLDALVERVDLVISLLPYIYHVRAAHIALKHKKHFSTTSYIAPEMTALHQQFVDNNTVCLNECGESKFKLLCCCCDAAAASAFVCTIADHPDTTLVCCFVFRC